MPPPLPPKPLGTYLLGDPKTDPPPVVEVACYLDLVCPFSGKMFRTLYEDILMGKFWKDERIRKFISIKIHHVVQPWHPSSALVHEAALAVKKVVDKSRYLEYISWVCKEFKGEERKFSDADTWNKTRKEIYEELIPSSLFPNENRETILELLIPPEGFTGNSGNGVTQDIKWATKHHRAMGVHVTPTVFVNGIEAVQISSGWTVQQWMEFFETFDFDEVA